MKTLINTTHTKPCGDYLIETTVTVRAHALRIDHVDILAAVEVVSDDEYRVPWEECDGLEHDVRRIDDVSERDSRGTIRGNRDYYDNRIVVSDQQLEKWGIREYAHNRGASKQVAFELAARQRQTTIDYLLKCYQDGWQYWGVRYDYLGQHASCYGIDSYDYAAGDMRREIASEMAGNLEAAGYLIENEPAAEKGPAYRSRLNEQNWN